MRPTQSGNHAPIKVLHTVHSLRSGGAERQLTLLCSSPRHLAQWQSAIFCVEPTGHTFPPGFVRLYVSDNSSPLTRHYWRSLLEAIDDFQPDIVHTWLPASITIPSMVLGHFRNRAVIFSYRSSMHFHRPLSYPEYMVTALFADAIVSNNQLAGSNRLFKWLFRKKNGAVIPNAVSPPPDLMRRPTFPLTREAWRLLFVGRLTAAKNLPYLISAFSMLRDLPLELDIVGDGESRQTLARLVASAGLDDRVRLHGRIDNVYPLMVRSDLLALPSLWEGMPNVVLEAMAVGLPVLLSDIPAHRAFLRDHQAAIWIDPYRPDSLATVVRQCVTGAAEPKLPCIARRGLEIARQHSVDSMVTAYGDLYERLAHRRTPL